MDVGINGFELVDATINDLDYFLSCVKRDILFSVTDEERTLSDTWIDDALALARFSFTKRPMLDEVFILRRGDADAGMLWLGVSRDQFTMDSVGYVLGIFVEEEYRKKGLGKAMMGCAEQWTKKKNFVTLALNVGERNSVAMEFYEKLGFLPQTRVMRKHLK